MKKLLQIPLLFVALFLTSIPISAHDFEVDGIYYNILTDSTVEVTYRGSNPDTYSNEYTGLVTIPSSVRYMSTSYSVTLIDYEAFRYCTNLTSVSIGNSVTSIDHYAFYECSSLTEVTIGNSVATIGYSAFGRCCSLASIVVESGNVNIDSRDNCNAIIATAANTLVLGCKNTIIPNSVTSIYDSSFSGCSGLTSVTIPNSVTEIGSNAFFGCSGLTSVTIPNSVTTIGNEAFSGCTGLTSVDIPNSVTSIGERTFFNCTSLTSVSIGNSVTSIGDYAFYECSGLTSATIPNSVTKIGEGAFSGCTSLTSATIPNSVTSIGEGAFSGCTSLTSATIPNSVTSIGYYAFYECSSLTSVTIPNSVTEIGNEAFSGCSGLTSVTIPNSVTSIGYSAFYECSSLTSVSIPNSVTTIGNEAFSGCTGLTEVYITDLSAWCKINFESYDANPLYYAGHLKLNGTEITNLVIPNDITEIKFSAFRGCSGLTSVTIPNSVTSIGYSAFRNCTGLTSATIPNSVTSIGSSAFDGCTGLTEVTIPNSVTSIGGDAFYGCTGLTEVTIPNSVTEIGDYAFYDCTGLVDCNIETTHTSATIGLSSNSNCIPYFEYYDAYYYNGNIISGLSPYTNASNWGSSSGRYSYEYGLSINGLRCKIGGGYFYTKQINLFIDGTAGVTYVDCSWSHTDDDATLVSEKMVVNNSSMESEDNTVRFENLDPNTSYTFDYTLKYKEFNSNFNISKTFTTGELSLTTQEAKPTSTTSVRLLAATNCDATEGTGFEWRRYDAPDELPSSKVSCPVVDGVLVGSLRGVKDDVYYKYRPYYTSSSGNTYYGEWIAFFTGDANVYFEPDVRTYDDIQVINNSATVKGYALEGTDIITAQGFEYWKTGSAITPSSTENRMTVNASGIAMSATLANLEYNSTYKYRAFVTTAKGTVYGDEVEFSTGNDPAGIGNIEIDADEFSVTLRENPATGTAWVKILGTAGEEVQYTITSMSGAMIATGTVMLDGEWNAIDLNCSAGMYLLTINDGTQVKTLRLIVK